MVQKGDWKNQISETEMRWLNFIAKLEERLDELCTASIPELEGVYSTDSDDYKRTYHHLLSGIIGQINNIVDKANDVFDEKVRSFFDQIEDQIDDDKLERFLDDIEHKCAGVLREFEESVHIWRDRLNETKCVDLEAKYQSILDEYEQIKYKFKCKQCGSSIALSKIFFITTHIACPACQTQNTFEPSSQASLLEHLGRSLAEDRTKHLLKEYETENERERELYHQMHELSLSIILEENKQKKASVESQIAVLEEKRQEAIANTPKLYKIYMRAMFDEWNRIVPDLAEHNERVYQSWLKGVEKDYIID